MNKNITVIAVVLVAGYTWSNYHEQSPSSLPTAQPLHEVHPRTSRPERRRGVGMHSMQSRSNGILRACRLSSRGDEPRVPRIGRG